MQSQKIPEEWYHAITYAGSYFGVMSSWAIKAMEVGVKYCFRHRYHKYEHEQERKHEQLNVNTKRS